MLMGHWIILQSTLLRLLRSNFIVFRLFALSLAACGEAASHDGEFLKKPTPGARVISLDKLTIPIIKGDRIFAYLRFTVHLQAKTDALFSKLEKLQPVLNDAIYRDLYGAMSDVWMGDKSPTLETIQQRVQKTVNRWFSLKGDVMAHIRDLFLHNLPKKEEVRPKK